MKTFNLFRKHPLILIAGIWTILVSALIAHEINHLHAETETTAITEAHTIFKKDLALRHWVASHGGVYVPIDATTPANKYLVHLPERDIQTPSAKNLTLMNPAYAMRQMHESYAKTYGVRGHITSLKLLRPENIADLWETRALQSFEQGKREVSELTDLSGKPFLRYMWAMITERPCLKCHQGYQVGDVRGGISVSIPMTDLLAKESRERLELLLSHGLIWLSGLLLIYFGGRRVMLSTEERNQANKELLRHKQHLEIKIRQRTAELTEANQKLEHISLTDGLTGIANRRHFDNLIAKEWSRAIREKTPITLIMIDIDYFKLFNDLYGHPEGDICLKTVAMALNAEMRRSTDFVARYGGEEFAAILPNTGGPGALVMAEKMRASIAKLEIEHKDSEINNYLTISLGAISVVPKKGSDFSHFIEQADKALYTAKTEGRNQARAFSPDGENA
ncbi:diguanylate cyclase domain-containing protein [Desulfotalea psychrophila]|uniref:diguanylate cyclase n=1 Tax=Desulfotalea psychrophila (strain LSv54 / DSM 12343) TaxID=177439 RepID=Q6ARI2_DESPS|nr:diguanylate cyclase [Desulfotalea psychrophila]CAG35043.1 probable sensory transduction system regulatory protein [Desulfotalea psychrophila LSv54]